MSDSCNDGTIDVMFYKSEEQVTDIMTKSLKQAVFVKLRRMLGVCSSQDVIFQILEFLLKLISVDISLREGVKNYLFKLITISLYFVRVYSHFA